jgi:Protein of unknown function (DUF3050)
MKIAIHGDNREVNELISSPSIEGIEARIAPLRERLTRHPLYAAIKTREHLQLFMESHVFAVWDFMSLLKALQKELTCVSVPWTPTRWPESRRFINEIVLGEESDQFEGRAVSHFEVYLEAMEECGADTAPIRTLVQRAPHGLLLEVAPESAQEFVGATFALIDRASVPAMAAAFTFGREDVIPDIFRELVRDLNRQQPGSFGKFIWYLERHIEVDGEDHGPLSLRMVADLCGDDAGLWEEAAVAAETAIEARLALWDGILELIRG